MAKTVAELPAIEVDMDKIDLGALLDLEEGQTLRHLVNWFTSYTNLTEAQLRQLAPGEVNNLSMKMRDAIEKQNALSKSNASS